MLEYIINGKISNINVGMQNQHAVKIDEHFSRIHTKEDLLKLKELCSKLKVYFICFTNRCGSNLVYESLSKNGIIKEPIEILNFDTVIAKSSIEKFNC